MAPKKKQVDSSTKKIWRTTCKKVWTPTALCISLAMLVGAAVFFVQELKQSKENVKTSTVDVEPGQQKWKNLRDSVLDVFSPLDKQFAVQINNPASAEWKALQWMVVKDTIPVSTQRYAMTVIWILFGLELQPLLNECEWTAVECTDKTVSGLKFVGIPVVGRVIPRQLSYLPSIETLDLSDQGLKGSIPALCYSQWTNLKSLNLEGNYLTSVFSGMEKGNWTSLQVLNVKNNVLDETVTDTLSALTNLRSLDVKGNYDLKGTVSSEYRIDLPAYVLVRGFLQFSDYHFLFSLWSTPFPTGPR